jgi:hypothetical protein
MPLPKAPSEEGDPVNTSERTFVVLRYVNNVPAMAACAKCQHKFFTPNSYYNDEVGAEEYLHGKFNLHECRGVESQYQSKVFGRHH